VAQIVGFNSGGKSGETGSNNDELHQEGLSHSASIPKGRITPHHRNR
jgi:hypothetical protein